MTLPNYPSPEVKEFGEGVALLQKSKEQRRKS